MISVSKFAKFASKTDNSIVMTIRRISFQLLCICLLAMGSADAKTPTKTPSRKKAGKVRLLQVNTGASTKLKGWDLLWNEEFEGTELDTTSWSNCTRGGSDWNKHMSDKEGLRTVKDGSLHLYAIHRPEGETDGRTYLTGGVKTEGKRSLKLGRVDVRARLGCAQGFWPAIWLMPDNDKPWPSGGEIDIMEHLNHDDIAYQTVHSTYTKNRVEPVVKSSATGPIDRDGFNVYSVIISSYSVDFYINGRFTYSYPRLFPDREGQFPFAYNPYYIILSAQLGGGWVGEIDPAQLPVEMEVDYVRFYSGRGKGMR